MGRGLVAMHIGNRHKRDRPTDHIRVLAPFKWPLETECAQTLNHSRQETGLSLGNCYLLRHLYGHIAQGRNLHAAG